jgi:hypothetical protein
MMGIEAQLNLAGNSLNVAVEAVLTELLGKVGGCT